MCNDFVVTCCGMHVHIVMMHVIEQCESSLLIERMLTVWQVRKLRPTMYHSLCARPVHDRQL